MSSSPLSCWYPLGPVWGIEWASVSSRLGLQQTLLVSRCFFGALILFWEEARRAWREMRGHRNRWEVSAGAPLNPLPWGEQKHGWLLAQLADPSSHHGWSRDGTTQKGQNKQLSLPVNLEVFRHQVMAGIVLSPSCSKRYGRSHGGDFLQLWIIYPA